MKEIISQYNINEHTMALLPAAHPAYKTIVLEQKQQYLVKRSPIQLIKESCLNNGSTYDGRKAAVTHKTGFKRKLPIPIKPGTGIMTFPTHPQTDLQCSWVFHNHILQLKQYQSLHNPSAKSMIIFKNGEQLPMDLPCSVLESQMQRAFVCALEFGMGRSGMWGQVPRPTKQGV